jgi:Ninjurin
MAWLITFLRDNFIQSIVTGGPASAPAPVAEGGTPAVGGFDNDKYATMKSAAQGLLNGSILLGNIILIISLTAVHKKSGVEMFAATTVFLCLSILFEFINAIIAIFLMTMRRGSATSAWFAFWAVLLSFVGLILNAIASYLVSQVAPQLARELNK